MKALIVGIGTVRQTFDGTETHADFWMFATNDKSDHEDLTGTCGWTYAELAAIEAVNTLFGKNEALSIASQLARGAK